MNEADAAELAAWRELFAAVAIEPRLAALKGESPRPLLPRPEWPQDVAFIAFALSQARAAQDAPEEVESLEQARRAKVVAWVESLAGAQDAPQGKESDEAKLARLVPIVARWRALAATTEALGTAQGRAVGTAYRLCADRLENVLTCSPPNAE